MPFILERRLFPICSAFPRAINKPRDRCLDRSLLEFPKTFISSQTTQSYSLKVYSLNSLSALFENEILTCVFKKIHSFRNYVHIINNYKGLEWRWHAGDSDFFLFKQKLGIMRPRTSTFIFYYFWPSSVWDLSSPTRDRTRARCIGSTES